MQYLHFYTNFFVGWLSVYNNLICEAKEVEFLPLEVTNKNPLWITPDCVMPKLKPNRFDLKAAASE
jgi:hypothetical protein